MEKLGGLAPVEDIEFIKVNPMPFLHGIKSMLFFPAVDHRKQRNSTAILDRENKLSLFHRAPKKSGNRGSRLAV
jgi:hypothetical protein